MEDYIFPFEKLEVWNLSVDFADYVLKVLESFPDNKYFRLIGQMEAAVASVAQNIAEGKGRQYNKEFVQYLYIAEGSLFEVLTLSELFRRRNLFKENEAAKIREMAILIDRKIRGLIKSLKKRT
ncbi:MAG: four helix bundle protein [Desulfobacterales bacterium]|uniref:Four helix bundle protein n=1 Tax=Candidatus Desulfatibia vada TaxID=2841696 RepID=A0A8J6P134_9BACT|nr:four helix bundle protein [Candidatus Desulfatibia vada]MBL6971949.1 four helix bundle protein [Desulfobacterales bacterium]